MPKLKSQMRHFGWFPNNVHWDKDLYFDKNFILDIDESSADGQTLQMFQQQRLYHTMRLKREIAKLERMEKDIAQKASEIGDIAMKASGTQTSRASSSYGQYN